ncbi:uncharacterized protein LOC110759341 [Prunus avium]|uniref:Uncharacterized protein LOC110759341 n=1 Tax=Prunus avium TaxID=42229 RepID=A0A6P5SS84_PRUAV|nr:uncharacterized protein LOC110759341 [Prunus avium]
MMHGKAFLRFKKKGCPHYQKLIKIFGDTTTTGKHAHPSTKPSSDSATGKHALSSMIQVFSETSKKRNEILEKRFVGSSKSHGNDEVQSTVRDAAKKELMECLEILNNMEDIDGESVTWRSMFLRMPDRRKKEFIYSL